jgi:hypothetical protein
MPKRCSSVLDRRARVGDEAVTRILADQRLLGHIMLVVYLADDLLDQILDRDETVGAAIFIHDKGEMKPRQLHAEQQIEHRHGRRHVEDLADDVDGADGAGEVDGAEVEICLVLLPRRGDPRHEVADVDHAARVVERLGIDRKPRMLRLAEHAQKLGDCDGVLNCDDVGARNHDIFDGELAKAENVAEHGALLRAECVAAGFLAAGERILDHLAQIGLFAKAEAGEQALEPGRFLVRDRIAGCRKLVVGERCVAHCITSAATWSASSA